MSSGATDGAYNAKSAAQDRAHGQPGAHRTPEGRRPDLGGATPRYGALAGMSASPRQHPLTGRHLYWLQWRLTHAEQGACMKWEYLEVIVSHRKWEDSMGRSGNLATVPSGLSHCAALLNQLGDQGWELTGIAGSESTSYYRAFLKRPK
jgi:hypothetical protein